MGAPPKPADIPVFDVEKFTEYDGFIFGFPTRYGTMPAQMKALFDATGGLWVKGALVGKGASIFTSTGTLGGGQETTILTSLPVLTHHGIVFIPTGYSMGERMFDVTTVRGGSAYGAGTFAGADGSRQPTELELDMAEHQGAFVSATIKKLAVKSE